MPAHAVVRILMGGAVRAELSQRFARPAIRAVVDDALAAYDSQRAFLPVEATVGGRAMVRLAALTIGLYKALLARGFEASEARALTARVTGRIYARMADFPTSLSAVGSPDGRERLRRATDLFRRFPFGAPAYEMVDVAGDGDVVAFDVLRCPVAELFLAHGLGELCVESWCNLDFPLAERWGGRLERTTTIAGGAARCDFRWRG